MARPRLTPEIVRADDELWKAIDQVVREQRGYRRRRVHLRRCQDQLRRLVDDDAWNVVLDLEAATNDRHAWTLSYLVKWAFDEGLRSGRAGP